MIIRGISEAKLIEVINKVASNHERKAFAHFTQEDIRQIVWEKVLEKLKDFSMDKSKVNDVEKALENWLNKVISRQLMNFYRDEFLVPTQQNKKDKSPEITARCMSLYSPLEISTVVNSDNDCANIYGCIAESVEIFDYIISKLDTYELDILDSVLSGEEINHYYKSKLLLSVKKILSEYYGK